MSKRNQGTSLIFVFLASTCVVCVTPKNYHYNDLEYQENSDLYDLLDSLNRVKDENRREVRDQDLEHWTGRWMPARPDEPTPPPKVYPSSHSHEGEYPTYRGSGHRIEMGIPSKDCDDAKTNLTVDWNYDPGNHTCYGHKIIPSYQLPPLIYCEQIPKTYVADHKCMNEQINYDDDIPVYGTHRPLWPIYGEYKFLPKQRWLHSLEHGAVVMLYHPCANKLEVNRLRNVLTRCLRRYIITPYNLLTEDRPLALLTWGCRLTMSYTSPRIAKKFILDRALRGPEETPRDGKFDEGLLKKSSIVSDMDDTNLCPDL